jgi:hypothetical protein
MASKDLVTTAAQKLAAISEDIQTNYMNDTSDAVSSMAEPILDAETFEDMFIGAGLEPSADLYDVGLHVEEISFNKSDFEQGIPFYATFRGKKLSDGSDFVTNCGAWQVVVVAYKCLKNDWLPRNLMFHRNEKATSAGFHPVNTYPWDEF